MPQVDVASFFHISLWTAVIYTLGFLFLNSTFLFSFLSGLKLSVKRATAKYAFACVERRVLSNTVLFP
jgi:hypothetical protein